MVPSSDSLHDNRILATLSDAERERLLPHLAPVKLRKRDMLFEARTATRAVYFPASGVISMVLVADSGVEIEVGVIGREGVVNPSGGLAGNQAVARAMVQFDGAGWMLPNTHFNAEFSRGGLLQDRVLRFQQALLAQATQSVLCSRLHSLEARLCRWLLSIRDRAESDELQMTHEFLAAMLGSRRAGVSETLEKLRRAQLIETRRGQLTIRDRARMEKMSCECYAVTRDWLNFSGLN